MSERSGGSFKPTALAAYERGERRISLERFVALADVYGVAPDRLLAEILRALDGRPPDVIDVPAIGALDGPAGTTLRHFVERVMRLRGAKADMVTIRVGDLQVLSASLGMTEQDMRRAIEGATRR